MRSRRGTVRPGRSPLTRPGEGPSADRQPQVCLRCCGGRGRVGGGVDGRGQPAQDPFCPMRSPPRPATRFSERGCGLRLLSPAPTPVLPCRSETVFEAFLPPLSFLSLPRPSVHAPVLQGLAEDGGVPRRACLRGLCRRGPGERVRVQVRTGVLPVCLPCCPAETKSRNSGLWYFPLVWFSLVVGVSKC